MGDSERMRRAFAAIDAANADDPVRIRVRGELRPKELAHAELTCNWIERLCSNPSDALRLAARAHHVRRWEIPRSEYPAGRRGYHRWRLVLQEHHARVACEILTAEGWEPEVVERVGELVRKRGLGRDAEVQALEDALCLVFLETQFEAMADRLDDEKLVDVTRKTLAKMSPGAIARADEIPLSAAARGVLARAAESPSG